MRQAAQQFRSASGAARTGRAARSITLQRSRHTPCAVAEPPSRVANANHFHGSSNTQRESVTAHGVCLLRRGITLLELLVVMLIILMVTAAAIPVIAPAMQNRQMRESTRLVTSFMGAAKARAVQTGRPVGVVIERFNGQPFALQMAQVEVPPPYSGDIIGSKATVADLAVGSLSAGTDQRRIDAGWPFFQWFSVTIDPAEFNHRLIRVGDTIQLGGQGPIYTIFGPDAPVATADGVVDNATLEVAYVSPTNFAGKVQFPWLNAAPLPTPQPTTYQVFRQPVRTSSPPLQLPEGIVFDLSISGSGAMLFNTQVYTDPIGTLPVPAPIVRFDPQIIFSPSGRVEWVTNNAGQLMRPTDPIFLLLGRRELMFDVASRGTDARDIVFQNLSAPAPIATPTDRMPPVQNFWVVVGHQTGQVNTSEVAPHVQDYTNAMGYTLSGAALATYQDVIQLACFGTTTPNPVTGALSYARESQSLGGR